MIIDIKRKFHIRFVGLLLVFFSISIYKLSSQEIVAVDRQLDVKNPYQGNILNEIAITPSGNPINYFFVEPIQSKDKEKKQNKKRKRDREDYFTKRKKPYGWIYSVSAGWMGRLPDTTRLKDISIPGTHDSGSLFGSWLHAQTQTWSILSQLKTGIRYLDIRCRANGSEFSIQHGLVFQKLMFDDVMEDIVAFLKEQPTETIVMRVKNEFIPKKGSQPFQEIWDNYVNLYANYFYRGDNSNATLGDVRGKIFVMCNADCNGFGMTYDEDSYIQDWYKITSEDHMFRIRKDLASISSKMDSIVKFIDIADTSSKWVLNHLSGTEGMSPPSVAKITNPLAYSYIGKNSDKKNVGIIIMDFPGEKLVKRIFDTNLGSDCFCPAITFRNESQESWVEFRLPEGNANNVIEIGPGAYNNFVFPKCYRVSWTKLAFRCNASSCEWEKISGDWGKDSWCYSSKSKSKLVFTGDK